MRDCASMVISNSSKLNPQNVKKSKKRGVLRMALLKRNLVVVLALILALTAVLPMISVTNAQAATGIEKSVEVSGLSIRITNAENKKQNVDNLLLNYNANAVYLNNDVLYPASALASSMDLVLKHDKSINTLIVGENKKDRIIIQFPLNKTTFKVTFPKQTNQVKGFFSEFKNQRAPIVKNGVILVPLKFLATTLGYEWKFENYPAKLTPASIPGLSDYVKQFNDVRNKQYNLKKQLDVQHKALNAVDAKYPKVYIVSGKIDNVGATSLSVRGQVIDQRIVDYNVKNPTNPKEAILKNDEYITVETGNSGLINGSFNIDDRYDSTVMYNWGNGERFSSNKTTQHVNDSKPILAKIASIRAQINTNQLRAVAIKFKANALVQSFYNDLVANNPAEKVRLRYEQTIHHIRLALGFGFITYSEGDDKIVQAKQATIASYYGYAEKGWTEKAWDRSEEKADYSDLMNQTGVDLKSFNQLKAKHGAAKLFDLLNNQRKNKILGSLGQSTYLQEGKLNENISAAVTEAIAKYNANKSNYNELVKTQKIVRLYFIGRLQLLEEIFKGDKDYIAVRVQQTAYADRDLFADVDVQGQVADEDTPLGVSFSGEELDFSFANGQDLVINTAVNNALTHAGVTALMARGWLASLTGTNPLDNTDYKAADFMIDKALTVKNNPFKASHLDQKKQIELRALRYDWK